MALFHNFCNYIPTNRKDLKIMDHVSKVLDFIKANLTKNLSLLNFIEENPIYSAEKEGNSVLVRGVSDYPWVYLESRNEGELKHLISKLKPEDNYFAAIQDWIIPHLLQKKNKHWDIRTCQYHLPSDIQLPQSQAEILPLKTTDVDTIYDHVIYKMALSKDFIKDRIMKGYTASIRKDGKLIAWVLTYDDGAIGCLCVLDGYRNQGLGTSLCAKLISKIRRDGKTPFLYLGDQNNKEAETFFLNLGFKKTIPANWLYLR